MRRGPRRHAAGNPKTGRPAARGVAVGPAARRKEPERGDETAGTEVEDLAALEHRDGLRLRGAALLRAEELHAHARRRRHADRVAHLDLAAVRRAGGDEVLRRVARVVGRGAVDLARVLAREGAAAVRARAAVGVHDDLAPGEAGVAGGPARHEAPGRVDVEPRGGVQHPGVRELVAHHGLDRRADVAVDVGLGRRLVREHDRVDADRAAVLVDDAHLALRVGAQPRDAAALALVREAAHQAVRPGDRRGHELRRLAHGVAEHHPLVARALLVGGAAVDALRNVGRLRAKAVLVVEGPPVEALLGAVVADIADDAARDRLGIEPRQDVLRDLAEVRAEARPDERLGRDVRGGVDRQRGVEDGVADLVGDLVGVALRDGLGGEDVALHGFSLSVQGASRLVRIHRGAIARLGRGGRAPALDVLRARRIPRTPPRRKRPLPAAGTPWYHPRP